MEGAKGGGGGAMSYPTTAVPLAAGREVGRSDVWKGTGDVVGGHAGAGDLDKLLGLRAFDWLSAIDSADFVDLGQNFGLALEGPRDRAGGFASSAHWGGVHFYPVEGGIIRLQISKKCSEGLNRKSELPMVALHKKYMCKS